MTSGSELPESTLQCVLGCYHQTEKILIRNISNKFDTKAFRVVVPGKTDHKIL